MSKGIVIVTGGESSLGLGIRKELEANGYTPILLSRDCIRKGKAAIDERIAEIVQECGTKLIYGLVNNFGINRLSWIGETEEEDKAIFDINALAPYWVVNALKFHVYYGVRVLNVSSATHRVAQRTTTLYCASKAALVQMTRVMARELAPLGWVVNVICPGMIEGTEMLDITRKQVLELRGWSPEQAAQYETSLIPMGRATNVEEVSEACRMILEMPKYLNGSVIDFMGGV